MVYPQPTSEPIALIGSSCRFAGGITSPQKLGQVLSKPEDLSKPVPASRFSADAFSLNKDNDEYYKTAEAVKGYWLEQDHRAFDAHFFNINPKEAEAIDPQQRMLLEVTYEALESAGYTRHQYAGKDVAVYVGAMTCDYETLCARDDLNTSQYVATGTSRSMLSNRLSYFFNFQGPSVTIDTACSASLVALHQGVQSVRSGESIMACIAGVNVMCTPEQFAAEAKLHMLSPTGHCRMWDAKADGYSRGEGVVSLFIKTLSRALADGDTIQAIIRHTGVNSDGKTNGITVPSSSAQQRLIQSTYLKSGLNPKDPRHRPQYFEAHGTGTPKGDPIEARALATAFFDEEIDASMANSNPTISRTPLFVGSVKTVLGHTEGAAGLAGLLKVVQCVAHSTIFPNLHLESLNPDIASYYTNLQIPVEKVLWPAPKSHPRRASVNSFGFGGTNAHAIIEQYVPAIHNLFSHIVPFKRLHQLSDPLNESCGLQSVMESKICLPLLLSADSTAALHSMLLRYKDFLQEADGPSYDKLCWHLYNNRTAHLIRLAVVATDRSNALRNIDSIVEAVRDGDRPRVGPQLGIRSRILEGKPRILGIFTGQGAQYAGMSSGLFRINSVYRNTINILDAILQNCLDPPVWTLRDQLLAQEGASQIHLASISQPLCTAVQIALVDFLKSIGVQFSCVVGHSSGEIAAAYTAGRLSRRDAILIAYYRGRVSYLASGPEGQTGGMLVCGFSKAQAEDFCSLPQYKGRICVAADNSPTLVTLSGDRSALESGLKELSEKSVFARLLKVDKAYHSQHMYAASVAYSEDLHRSGVTFLNPDSRVKWVSSVNNDHGKENHESLLPTYWTDNMVKPVRFREAIHNAVKECGPFHCMIEVGPHATLKQPTLETAKELISIQAPYVGVLDRTKSDDLSVAGFIAMLWTNFDPCPISMRKYIKSSSVSHLIESKLQDAPTYPWDHSKIHWRESRLSEQYQFRRRRPHELLGVRSMDDNVYELRWRNILKLEKLPWLEGHKFQGQPLLPASAYCVMALDAARELLNSMGRAAMLVELQNLEFLRGITVEADSLGTETLFNLTLRPSHRDINDKSKTAADNSIQAEFSLSSVPVTSFGFSQMRMNFRGQLHILFDGAHGLNSLAQKPTDQGSLTEINVDAFYNMMSDTGLEYSGPFIALRNIRKGLNCATAVLGGHHAADSTGLWVSPATLDSCFHLTFAAFSSPGDKAVWTSFLPTKIGKLRFILPLDSSPNDHGAISVESRLTSYQPYSKAATGCITSDVVIFDTQGRMTVQAEDLTISSLAPSKPEDDYELYLHTVLELDPGSEIIIQSPWRAEKPASGSASEMTLRAHDDSRNGFSQRPKSPAQDVSQSCSTIRTLCEDHRQSSPSSTGLRSTSSRHISEVASVLGQSTVEDSQPLLSLQKHLSRIIQQIVHRYPRMNILDLSDPSLSLTEHVLGALQNTYQSYTVGSAKEGNALLLSTSLERMRSLRVKFLKLDAIVSNASLRDNADIYDLVILSVSTLENEALDPTSVFTSIRKIVSDGAFLVLINVPDASLRSNPGLVVASKHPQSPSTRSSDWLAWVRASEDHGFTGRPGSSDQCHPSGFSLSIRRQSDNTSSGDPAHLHIACSKDDKTTSHLLLVGGQTDDLKELARCLEDFLMPSFTKISTVHSPSEIPTDVAENCTAAIILTDLEAPVCVSMTARQLDALQHLMRPGMKVLWVTAKALEDPDRAASFGLTRTLKAEIPGLELQVLDLDEETGCAMQIAKESCLFIHNTQVSPRGESGVAARSYEPEIHIIKGKRFTPRVLPYQPAIERLNSYRRPVQTNVDAWQECLQLKPMHIERTGFKYSAQLVHDDRLNVPGFEATQLMRVQYSSSHPVAVGTSKRMYICFGRLNHNQNVVNVVLSPCLASVVDVHGLMMHEIPASSLDPLELAGILLQTLVAFEVLHKTSGKTLVLIDPSQTLLTCVRNLVRNHAKYQSTQLQVWSCDEQCFEECSEEPATLFRHPWSTKREIKNYLPHDCVVYDFLAEDSQLSKTLCSLGHDISYHRGLGIQSFSEDAATLDSETCKDRGAMLKEALDFALQQTSDQVSVNTNAPITPSELLEQTYISPSPCIVDWYRGREMKIEVQPTMNSSLVRGDRTYVLVGLTRDLGRSLCGLLVEHGARSIIIASRNPDMSQTWVTDFNTSGVTIHMYRLNVTILSEVARLKDDITSGRLGLPQVGGVINGAMVLDDRVFAQMDIETWNRVLEPKTTGSKNLDIVFDSRDLDFFIMTSSFAAIGGHAGQSNYAAANMYMNGLAMDRRRRGLAASVLNIGVIYGLGLLARERSHIYRSLEREGYPPISERDIHHMFIEAIEAGRPVPGQIMDLTTGLARYRVGESNPLRWHRDLRFSHHIVRDNNGENGGTGSNDSKSSKRIGDVLKTVQSEEAAQELIQESFCRRVEILLQLPQHSVQGDNRVSEIGIDSLVAVEMRNWFYKSIGQDVPVLKILGASSISELCHGVAKKVVSSRQPDQQT